MSQTLALTNAAGVASAGGRPAFWARDLSQLLTDVESDAGGLSGATELAVMLVLRTRRPCWRSRPGRALLATSAAVAAITVTLPFTPLAATLGLVPLPARVLVTLAALTVLYVAANEMAKRRFLTADWEGRST